MTVQSIIQTAPTDEETPNAMKEEKGASALQSKSKAAMQRISVSTSLWSPQVRSENSAKESDSTVVTSTETISSSNFSCTIRHEQQSANIHEDDRDRNGIKSFPHPNTLPRRVLVHRCRYVETSVSGISESSSEASSTKSNQIESYSFDFNSLVATASTKKLANDLNLLQTDTSSSSYKQNAQSEKKSNTQGPEPRRRQAKVLLSKMFRACTAIPLTHFDGNFFTEDSEQDNLSNSEDRNDVIRSKSHGASSNKVKRAKVINNSKYEDIRGVCEEEDGSSYLSYSTQESLQSDASNTVLTHDEAILYYSDRLVDFVFDTYATVQSTVKEGLERAQEHVQENKTCRRRSHIQREEAHLRRIRNERIRCGSRRRLKGLKEGLCNDGTDASKSRSYKIKARLFA